MKNRIIPVAFLLSSLLLALSCAKQEPIDLSLRAGDWKVTACTEIPEDKDVGPTYDAIFAVGDNININVVRGREYDVLTLGRVMPRSGLEGDFLFDFRCFLDGETITIREVVYASPGEYLTGYKSVQLSYKITTLNATTFILKRTDLGPGEGVVTMTRK